MFDLSTVMVEFKISAKLYGSIKLPTSHKNCHEVREMSE
jgi:hypothetical protein